ncbi:hypothetical protein, partial [Klebsiella pneumoniae]|uniref:hypothetical protein n=1 Tax=Klebsiella pneumoniae TaxID=573 RepID=UPI0020100A6B
EIKLNAIPIGRGISYISQDYVYTEGLNIDELLLETSRLIDKSHQEHPLAEKKSLTHSSPTPDELDYPLKGLDDYVEPLRPMDEMERRASPDNM